MGRWQGAQGRIPARVSITGHAMWRARQRLRLRPEDARRDAEAALVRSLWAGMRRRRRNAGQWVAVGYYGVWVLVVSDAGWTAVTCWPLDWRWVRWRKRGKGAR